MECSIAVIVDSIAYLLLVYPIAMLDMLLTLLVKVAALQY
jgi:hypothetical protein